MIALTEDPSTNAPAVARGTDGPTLEAAVPRSPSTLGADGTTSRPVEGSSVGEIKLFLRSCKPYYRQLTLVLSASGKLLDVTLDVRSKYAVLAFDELEHCCLHPRQCFISIQHTIFKLSADEVQRVREAFPMLRVRES